MRARKANTESSSLEGNLKKAMTELLLLALLSQREYFIRELTDALKERSGGMLCIVFPYAAMYRLFQAGHVVESDKRTAPDGRLRQYYAITESGRVYLKGLLHIHDTFRAGVDAVLGSLER